MSAKVIGVIIWLVIGFGVSYAQQGQRIEVSQDFIDSAGRAFAEVKLLRELVEEQRRQVKLLEESVRVRDELIRVREAEREVLVGQVEKLVKAKCSSVGVFWGLVKFRRCG